MGAEAEEYYSLGYTDRPGKKPSLHSRLQNGKAYIHITIIDVAVIGALVKISY